MMIKTHRFSPWLLISSLLLLVTLNCVSAASRELQETTFPVAGDTSQKCTPCGQYASPPPPPPPKKKPPSKYCPPPPPAPPSFIYITGPTGNLYPFDQYFSGGGRNMVPGLAVVVGGGILLYLLSFS